MRVLRPARRIAFGPSDGRGVTCVAAPVRSTGSMTTLDSLDDQWAVLLTTFRRDGTPVGTPVSLAVDAGRG